MRSVRYALLSGLAMLGLVFVLAKTLPTSTAMAADANSNLPARVNRGTPGSWTVIARERHNEWNSNAFSPSGTLNAIPTSSTTTGEDGLKQIYVALIGQLFTSFQQVLTSIVTGFTTFITNQLTNT